MTTHQATLLASFLRFAESRMGSDGCNDMQLLDTPENRALEQASWNFENPSEEYVPARSSTMSKGALFMDATPKPGKPRYFILADVTLCAYLRHQFEQEHAIELRSEGQAHEGFQEGL